MLARLFWFTLVHTVFTAFGQSDYSFQVRKYQCEIESLLPTTTTISSTTRSSTTSTFEFQSVLRSCPRTQCPLSFQAFETAMNSADTDNNKFYEVISYYQTMKKTFPDEDVRISCMINGIEMLQIPEIAKILSATELKQYCAVMSSVRLGLPSNILVGCPSPNQIKVSPSSGDPTFSSYDGCITACGIPVSDSCKQECIKTDGKCVSPPKTFTEFVTCKNDVYGNDCTAEGYSSLDYKTDSQATPPSINNNPTLNPMASKALANACAVFQLNPIEGMLWDDLSDRVDSGRCTTLSYYYQCGQNPAQLTQQDNSTLNANILQAISACEAKIDVRVCCGHTGVVELDNSECANNNCVLNGLQTYIYTVCMPLSVSSSSLVSSQVSIVFSLAILVILNLKF
eukprot:m.349593 g.349593  ORF g.349593 m.349593 type:complete len:398 (-) comp42839_c0_seq1:41-1234(-)